MRTQFLLFFVFFFIRIDSTALEYNDDDKDSVTSESSTEACRPVDDGNMTTALLSKPWVDICILEAIDPSTFVVRAWVPCVNIDVQ